MTQAGLSILIRELESQLDFRLFDRTTRTMTLTEEGQRFLVVAERYLSQLDSVVLDIRQHTSHAQQRIALGAPPMTCAHLLPTVLRPFRKEQPNCQVSVYDGELAAIAEQVLQGHLDFGLGMYMKRLPGLMAESLMQLPLHVAWPADQAPDSGTTTWRALRDLRLIGLPPSNPMQQQIGRVLIRAQRFTPDVVVNYIETQLALVEAGEGVAIVPGWTASACAHRRVRLTRLIRPVVNAEFFLLTARGRVLSPASQAFIACLRQHTRGLQKPGQQSE